MSMLRMYECNWCHTRQVKDDGSVTKYTNDNRNVSGVCYKRCLYEEGPLGMTKMTKGRDGDWEVGDGSSERNRVEPPIIWH